VDVAGRRSDVANVPEDVPRIERNFRRAYQRAELQLATATPPVDLKDTGMTTPVILYRPLPGQGVAGAEALAGDGYGTLARDRDELVGLVQRLAKDDSELVSRAAKGRELYRQQHSTSQLIVSLGSSS
jgi:hypothetical protein